MSTASPRVLVLGAGRIASGFDAPESLQPQTHALAWIRAGGRVAFQDPDASCLGVAKRKWGVEGWRDLDDALSRGPWDVVVVAAPDHEHVPLVRRLATEPWGVLILEKPPAIDRPGWNELRSLLAARSGDVAVNLSRRWVPGIVDLGRSIRAGEWGGFLCGQALYGNGLLHNGSHLVDLLDLLLGPLDIGGVARIVADRPGDPSADFRLLDRHGHPIEVLAVDCRAFTVFEADLLFERGRVRLPRSAGWLEVSSVVDSPRFAGFRELEPSVPVSLGLEEAMGRLVGGVIDHLHQGTPLVATLVDVTPGFSTCLDLMDRRDALAA